MDNEFCTLFDVNYLPRGLVLYRSLARVCDRFRLRVFCMDASTHELLTRLALPGLEVVSLAELEAHDPALRATKTGRTAVEYFWTATPAICRYALDREPDLQTITYLDADLMFFADPAPLFAELGEDSVLIVPHRYSPAFADLEAVSGTYNVQFMAFRRTADGLAALDWWRERCLEWCFARHENGRFGDQKYLDDWPERFAGVHVLEHSGGGLAPWNVAGHALAEEDGNVTVDGRPLVFFHFHALRLYRGGLTALRRLGLASRTYRYTPAAHAVVWTSDYPVQGTELRLLWEPYVRALAKELAWLQSARPGLAGGFTTVPVRTAVYQAARDLVPVPLRRGLRRAQRALAPRRAAVS